ncbi:MAG: glycosyltransferase family 9 protein [Chitinophagales bacterium]
MKILVIRFSSLGDVLLTIPVFKTLEKRHPTTKYFLLTRPHFKDFFASLSNVEVITVDIDNQYKGLIGLTQLANHLKSYQFDVLVDLHDVLRTKILRKLLTASINKIVVFDKGRKAKKAIISKKSPLTALPHTCDRYLKALDFDHQDLHLVDGPWLTTNNDASHLPSLQQNHLLPKSNKWIGIAPFSKHQSKEWIEENWLKVIEKIKADDNQVFVFAFGNREKSIVTQWQKDFNDLIIIDEQYNIPNQLAIMNALDVMISVDSANMHLAALLGTKVISIWIATHPYLGFGPLENEDYIIQASTQDAPWHPLSVYGKINGKDRKKLVKKAKQLVTSSQVLEKIEDVLKIKF